MNCVFCKLKEHDWEPVWENGSFVIIFDPSPVSPGHMLVVAKRHVDKLLDLTPDEWTDLRDALQASPALIENTDLTAVYNAFKENKKLIVKIPLVEKALADPRLGTAPDGYNYGVNDGAAAGRTVDHLHLHIIPRYEGDTEDPRGGIRHVIPGHGSYQD